MISRNQDGYCTANFRLNRVLQSVRGRQNYRKPPETSESRHGSQEIPYGVLPDLTPVLNSFRDGFTEMKPDEDTREPVLFRRL